MIDGTNSGISSSASSEAQGNAGSIDLKASSVSLSNEARLDASNLGRGNAGSIEIAANEKVSFDNSLAVSRVLRDPQGQGGEIEIAADSLSFTNGSQISVLAGGGGSVKVEAQNLDINGGSSFFAGIREGLGSPGVRAGNIEIDVAENVKIQGNFSNVSAIENRVSTRGVGNAGDVIINARSLSLSNNAIVSTSTAGQGNAGNLIVNASESVQLIGTSANGQRPSGLRAETLGTGNGGTLTVDTKNLLVQDGAGISTSTAGAGNAGDLTVRATESMQLIGTSANGQRPSALSAETLGTGNGGTLTVDTKNLLVRDGALISTTTIGAGNAGSLTVKATESVQLIGTSAQGNIISSLVTGTIGNRNAGDLTVHKTSCKSLMRSPNLS